MQHSSQWDWSLQGLLHSWPRHRCEHRVKLILAKCQQILQPSSQPRSRRHVFFLVKEATSAELQVHLHDDHTRVPLSPSENPLSKYVIVAAEEHFFLFCSLANIYRAKKDQGRSQRPDGKADTEQTDWQRCSQNVNYSATIVVLEIVVV